MVTTPTTMDALQNSADTPSFIRKMGVGLGFLAPMTVSLPDALTDVTTSQILSLDVGWNPVGIVNPDGYTFSSEFTEEDVEAFGYATPPRSDVTGIARTVAFSPYELHKRNMQELTLGMDLSTTTQAASGEVVFDESSMPVFREYRLLVIGSDGPADAQWILGLGFYRVKLSAADAEQWQKQGALTRSVTLKVLTDDDSGSPVRRYIGGTAAKTASATLGYTQAV